MFVCCTTISININSIISNISSIIQLLVIIILCEMNTSVSVRYNKAILGPARSDMWKNKEQKNTSQLQPWQLQAQVSNNNNDNNKCKHENI